MTKASLFSQDRSHILKNKNNTHIMLNYSRSLIPQLEENKEQYTTCDTNKADRKRLLQNITVQPVKWILHAVDKNIL